MPVTTNIAEKELVLSRDIRAETRVFMTRHVFICIAVLTVSLGGTSANAQSFLNGDWVGAFHEDQPERGPGPDLGDYLGIPINAAGRQYADSWDASRLTLPEHQCRAHVSPYIYRGPIRVRMGLHTGTPHLGREGYVGEDVHLGARIAAAGHGGQVLLSKATRARVEEDVLDLGEHRLKDFGAPVWIYQLGSDR